MEGMVHIQDQFKVPYIALAQNMLIPPDLSASISFLALRE